ncbi:MAG TPA: response regulator transcription factor, partial [Bacillota bacterium]
GFYWCRQIRTVSKVPVVFLSARTGDMDQVLAMENGGDDYVTKPFSLEVLIAKIRSLLRRVYGEYAGAVPSRLRTVGPLLLDEDRGQIACGERRTDLSHTEFRLLDLLARQAGRVVGREELLAALWDDVSFVDDNTLNVNVARVRRKLEEVGFPGGIATKRGQGYRLEVGDGPDRPGGPTGPGEGASGR